MKGSKYGGRKTLVLIACGLLAIIHTQTVSCAKDGVLDLDEEWATDLPVDIPQADPANLKEQKPTEPAISKNFWARSEFKYPQGRKLYFETGVLVFSVLFLINIFIGRKANNNIAGEWAKQFCTEGSVFDKNFALLGARDDAKTPLLKESASEFMLYASGRRFCKSMTATLKLKRRQDLFMVLIDFLFPQDDILDVEVYIKESNMPQNVLAIGTKKAIKAMLAEEGGEDDVKNYARKMDVGKERIQNWPNDKLVVHTEHSSVFYDIMTEPLLEHIFRRPAFDTQGKYFRFLHFTPEQTYGSKDQKSVLRFSFNLPPRERMTELTKLVSSIGVFIDIVGNYKLSPELQKRAEKLRQDVDKKTGGDKSKEMEALAEERRNARKVEEFEKLRKMTPEQREKYQERKAKIAQGRQQKKFMRRV